jgi:hypothetical protein
VSIATRDELLAAVSERYRASGWADKSRIVEEFAAAPGYHRKHAMRVLRAGPSGKRSAPLAPCQQSADQFRFGPSRTGAIRGLAWLRLTSSRTPVRCSERINAPAHRRVLLSADLIGDLSM